MVLENGVLTRMFGPERERAGVTGVWRKRNFPNCTVRVDEMGRACGMCGEEEKCIGCKVLWVKPGGKRPFGNVITLKSKK